MIFCIEDYDKDPPNCQGNSREEGGWARIEEVAGDISTHATRLLLLQLLEVSSVRHSEES